MNTKIVITVLISLFLISLNPTEVNACEIDIEVTKGKKETYQVGDTLVLHVKVVLTHRSCPVKMKDTKFNMTGLKVHKSTPWKQTAAMDWERKLMVIVTETKKGKLNLSAVRECEKDGGFGSIKLDVAQ